MMLTSATLLFFIVAAIDVSPRCWCVIASADAAHAGPHRGQMVLSLVLEEPPMTATISHSNINHSSSSSSSSSTASATAAAAAAPPLLLAKISVTCSAWTAKPGDNQQVDCKIFRLVMAAKGEGDKADGGGGETWERLVFTRRSRTCKADISLQLTSPIGSIVNNIRNDDNALLLVTVLCEIGHLTSCAGSWPEGSQSWPCSETDRPVTFISTTSASADAGVSASSSAAAAALLTRNSSMNQAQSTMTNVLMGSPEGLVRGTANDKLCHPRSTINSTAAIRAAAAVDTRRASMTGSKQYRRRQHDDDEDVCGWGLQQATKWTLPVVPRLTGAKLEQDVVTARAKRRQGKKHESKYLNKRLLFKLDFTWQGHECGVDVHRTFLSHVYKKLHGSWPCEASPSASAAEPSAMSDAAFMSAAGGSYLFMDRVSLAFSQEDSSSPLAAASKATKSFLGSVGMGVGGIVLLGLMVVMAVKIYARFNKANKRQASAAGAGRNGRQTTTLRIRS